MTNATLTKCEANKLADIAHDGYAMTIKPAHTMVDGDAIFALASGEIDQALCPQSPHSLHLHFHTQSYRILHFCKQDSPIPYLEKLHSYSPNLGDIEV